MEIVNENKVISTINNEVKTTGSIEVDVIENKDLKVEVQRREYSIVGDELYIPKRYEDAPQWLRDLISTVTNESFNQKITELNGLSATLNQLIVELEVAKNTYTQSIISSNDINERINTAVTTLNSSIAQSDATLVDMINTRATPDEASTLALNVLNSSIENGAINALTSSIQNSSVARDQALANDISLVHSEMTGEFEATSEAITSLSTYVGVDASTFVADGTGLLGKVEILEKQADGVIETITGTYDVMLGNNDLTYDLVEDAEPYASWVSSEEPGKELVRASHVGDVYIKYQNEANGTKTYLAAYKFIKTVVDTTAPYGTDDKGYTWAIVTDTDTQNAYMAALKAYDLADGKRRVFVTTPFGPYETGDLWTDPTGELKRCKDGVVNLVIGSYNEIDWELATGYTENLQAYTNSVVDELSINLQNQIDGKIEYWFNISTNDPKAAWTTTELKLKHNGDIWYQTDTKISYYYSNVTDTWNLITNKDALYAIELANTAQATADGKVTVYYALEQATAPSTTSLWYKTTDTKLYKYVTSWILVSPLTTGDLLYTNNGTEDNRPYRFNGTSWISARDGKIIATANALTKLSTDVLDPTTGAIVTAVNNVEQSLRTEIENGDSTVESKWAYNSTVELAGVPYSSGFGMVTSASNINGKPASGSEFWISADKFKFTNANNTGAKAPFTIDATGTTPEITFNGKVSFTNVTNVPQLGSTPQEVVTAINNAETTTINGPRITTGSIGAAQIQANSISADRLMAGTNSATVWAGGGLVSQDFNGNAAGSIGSPTKGFRLSSNAAGTSADPNIYGAYIQGSTIDVTDMKVRASGYPNNFGRISYAAKNIAVFMPNYGSGYAVNRLCSRALGIVKIDCWARGYDDRVIISLQCTTDWVNWTTIRTHSSLVAGMTNKSHVTIVFSELLDNSWFSDNNIVGFRMVDAGSEQPATHVFSDILVSIFNS